ncbi:YcnI-like [Acidimicrobiia bacterium]
MPMSLRRILLSVGVGAAALVALGAPASAHTEGVAKATSAGRTEVSLTIENECAGGTTNLRVQLPAGSTSVSAESPGNWIGTVSSTEVSWTGGVFTGSTSESFTITLVLAQPAGNMVAFPTLQGCADGSTLAWIEPNKADGSEPEFPAPQVKIPVNSTTAPTTAVGSAPTTAGSGPTTTARMAIEETPITQEGTPANSGGLVIGAICIGAIVIGFTLLYVRNRKPRTGN